MIGSMLDMKTPKGARPGTFWAWARAIVILVLGVVAYVLCVGEGPVLAVGAGGTLMGTLHAILPRSAPPPSDESGAPGGGPAAGLPG